MTLPFFTIGHSNRGLEDFIDLLTEADIQLVADIRKIPRSRANPQFNTDALAGALSAEGIAYEYMAALGGRRSKAKAEAPATNAYWTNQSFHNYADYALTREFAHGLEHLVQAGRRRRCAIMCAEAVWWRCHRRIVADYLIAAGETVFHIMGPGRTDPARLTPAAVVQPGGGLGYPAG